MCVGVRGAVTGIALCVGVSVGVNPGPSGTDGNALVLRVCKSAVGIGVNLVRWCLCAGERVDEYVGVRCGVPQLCHNLISSKPSLLAGYENRTRNMIDNMNGMILKCCEGFMLTGCWSYQSASCSTESSHLMGEVGRV